MKRTFKLDGIGAIFFLLFFVVAIGGWAWNIIKFVSMLDGGLTAMFIARIVGIFVFPLGSVLGFF